MFDNIKFEKSYDGKFDCCEFDYRIGSSLLKMYGYNEGGKWQIMNNKDVGNPYTLIEMVSYIKSNYDKYKTVTIR